MPDRNSSVVTITSYRQIVLLTDGYSTRFLAKTAMSLLRYRADDIIAVLDASAAGGYRVGDLLRTLVASRVFSGLPSSRPMPSIRQEK